MRIESKAVNGRTILSMTLSLALLQVFVASVSFSMDIRQECVEYSDSSDINVSFGPFSEAVVELETVFTDFNSGSTSESRSVLYYPVNVYRHSGDNPVENTIVQEATASGQPNKVNYCQIRFFYSSDVQKIVQVQKQIDFASSDNDSNVLSQIPAERQHFSYYDLDAKRELPSAPLGNGKFSLSVLRIYEDYPPQHATSEKSYPSPDSPSTAGHRYYNTAILPIEMSSSLAAAEKEKQPDNRNIAKIKRQLEMERSQYRVAYPTSTIR